MGSIQHVVSAYGPPTSAPPSIGAHYIDTDSRNLYLAKGTNGPGDWVLQGDGVQEIRDAMGQITVPPSLKFMTASIGEDWIDSDLELTIDSDPPRSFDLVLRTGPESGRKLIIRNTWTSVGESVLQGASGSITWTGGLNVSSLTIDSGSNRELVMRVMTGGQKVRGVVIAERSTV